MAEAGVRSRRAAAAIALLAAAACAHRPPGEIPSAERAPEPVEVGVASYYARSLEGRATASGVPYRRKAMTCAHRTAPFGTRLKVTDVETGRTVVVEVTDRGPFTDGRVIDLSWAAARALGILDRGVARVRVERLR